MSPKRRSFQKTNKMEKKNYTTTTAADFQATLNNELGDSIQKSVLFYLKGRDDSGMISPSEKEMIAEDAWVHVLEKRGKYDATMGAKFKTWAIKVATNFAKDKCEKLRRDALHLSGSLGKTEFDISVDNGAYRHQIAYGRVDDCYRRQYCRDMLDTLKRIVAGYSGRDREFGEMLINERTKEEMMAKTQMSGGTVDVCKSRVLKRMRADLLKAGYSLAA